jgi:hypothetical protein
MSSTLDWQELSSLLQQLHTLVFIHGTYDVAFRNSARGSNSTGGSNSRVFCDQGFTGKLVRGSHPPLRTNNETSSPRYFQMVRSERCLGGPSVKQISVGSIFTECETFGAHHNRGSEPNWGWDPPGPLFGTYGFQSSLQASSQPS